MGKKIRLIQKNKEAVAKFVNDFNEVLGIEEEIEINTIDVEQLEGVKLSASDLDALAFMLCLH